ncbi:hypothetical protein HV410_12570 [Enterococcus faecium]|nr:hypothetical protein [Enterococcus faecium]
MPIKYKNDKLMNQIQIKGATLEVLNLPSMNGIEDENLRRLINSLVIELYKYQAESERKKLRNVRHRESKLLRKRQIQRSATEI